MCGSGKLRGSSIGDWGNCTVSLSHLMGRWPPPDRQRGRLSSGTWMIDCDLGGIGSLPVRVRECKRSNQAVAVRGSADREKDSRGTETGGSVNWEVDIPQLPVDNVAFQGSMGTHRFVTILSRVEHFLHAKVRMHPATLGVMVCTLRHGRYVESGSYFPLSELFLIREVAQKG